MSGIGSVGSLVITKMQILFYSILYFYISRLIYRWFYNVHRVTYALGIIGYLIIMCTFLGLNLMFLIAPDTAMGAGMTVLFYGLYYGVLGRDGAEFCTDRIAAKMGVRNS